MLVSGAHIYIFIIADGHYEVFRLIEYITGYKQLQRSYTQSKIIIRNCANTF